MRITWSNIEKSKLHTRKREVKKKSNGQSSDWDVDFARTQREPEVKLKRTFMQKKQNEINDENDNDDDEHKTKWTTNNCISLVVC